MSTRSGFAELHVVSTALASKPEKAIASSASLHGAYPEMVAHTLITDRADPRLWTGAVGLAKLHLLEEEAVYPKPCWAAHYAKFAHLSPQRCGWYYQQLLKLTFLFQTARRLDGSRRPEQVGLLIWDADTRLIRPVSFRAPDARRTYSCHSGNPYDRHPPFYTVNAALTGIALAEHQPFSNIVQFAALSLEEVLQLAGLLQLDLQKSDFADGLAARLTEAILAVGEANSALFSEYELIGLFQHRAKAPLRRIRMIRTNKRTASLFQLRLMRYAGIAHYTSEEWWGEQLPLSYLHLSALILLQLAPAFHRLKPFLGRTR